MCLGAYACRRFMHGVPIPPYRVRTNTGSGFLAIRIAILSCRTDSVHSKGNMSAVWGRHKVDGGSLQAPLCAAIASLECNTSGLFYKGFPRTIWLQVGHHRTLLLFLPVRMLSVEKCFRLHVQ